MYLTKEGKEDIFKKVYDIVKITRKEILDAEFTKLRKN